MHKLDLSDVVRNARFSGFHVKLLAIASLIILFDGYDIAIYGMLVPSLIEEWNLDTIQAGMIGSVGLFGMLFGATVFGMLADRIGRRKVIIMTALIFSVFTSISGFSSGPEILTVFRFLAGLDLGGIMPNAIALMTDFMPQKQRTLAITIMLACYSVGSIIAPLAGIFLIPTVGWRWVLWLTIVPMLALPLMMRWIPESPGVVLARGEDDAVRSLARRIDPSIRVSSSTAVADPVRSTVKIPLSDLFSGGRGAPTVLFAAAFFTLLLLGYGLVNWLPKMMMDAGHDLTSSLTFTIVLQVGAIVGTLILGPVAGKTGFKRILIPMYLTAALTLLLLAFPPRRGAHLRARLPRGGRRLRRAKHRADVHVAVLPAVRALDGPRPRLERRADRRHGRADARRHHPRGHRIDAGRLHDLRGARRDRGARRLVHLGEGLVREAGCKARRGIRGARRGRPRRERP